MYKISDRMSHLGALYDNFEIFRKKIFNGRKIFENRGAVREISTHFQSENAFELTTYRRIKFWAIRAGSCKSLLPSLFMVIQLNEN